MRETRAFVVVAVSVLALLLAACGTPAPIPTPPAGPDDGAEPLTGFEAEWDALIKAAQKEGRLIVSGSGGVGEIVPIYRIWGEKFGIRVTVARGGGRENADRMLAEQSVGRYSVDMVHGGGSTLAERLMPNNAVIRIEELLFHPEVIDKSLWYGGKLWFIDPEEAFMLAFAGDVDEGSSLDDIWFNTDLVRIEELEPMRNERDVYERFEGSIINLDPRAAGGGTSVVSDYLNPNMGPDHWDFVYSKDAFYTSDMRLLADSLAKGGYKIAVDQGGQGGRGLEALRAAGAPVEEYHALRIAQGWPVHAVFPQLNPGGSGGSMAVAPNQPHPNATKLWVNWLLSREGATAIHATPEEGAADDFLHDRVTLRADDIPWGMTDPRFRRVPGVVYDTIRMNPKAAAMQADMLTLQSWIFEEVRGFATHPELEELRAKIAKQAAEIEGVR